MERLRPVRRRPHHGALPLTTHSSPLTPPSPIVRGKHDQQPTPSSSLLTPTPHSSLLTPHSSLLTPHSHSCTPHDSLLTPHSSPSLLTPHSSLPSSLRLLTPHSSLLTPHSSLLTPDPHSSPSSLLTPHSSLLGRGLRPCPVLDTGVRVNYAASPMQCSIVKITWSPYRYSETSPDHIGLAQLSRPTRDGPNQEETSTWRLSQLGP